MSDDRISQLPTREGDTDQYHMATRGAGLPLPCSGVKHRPIRLTFSITNCKLPRARSASEAKKVAANEITLSYAATGTASRRADRFARARGVGAEMVLAHGY
jgi:hypothetical protein